MWPINSLSDSWSFILVTEMNSTLCSAGSRITSIEFYLEFLRLFHLQHYFKIKIRQNTGTYYVADLLTFYILIISWLISQDKTTGNKFVILPVKCQ